jgi:hypothetical protein
VHDLDSSDVSFRIDANVHCDIAVRTAGSRFRWVGSLLLLQHLRWRDGRWSRVLGKGAWLCCEQGAESEKEVRPGTERSRQESTLKMDGRWGHEISSIGPKAREHGQLAPSAQATRGCALESAACEGTERLKGRYRRPLPTERMVRPGGVNKLQRRELPAELAGST